MIKNWHVLSRERVVSSSWKQHSQLTLLRFNSHLYQIMCDSVDSCLEWGWWKFPSQTLRRIKCNEECKVHGMQSALTKCWLFVGVLGNIGGFACNRESCFDVIEKQYSLSTTAKNHVSWWSLSLFGLIIQKYANFSYVSVLLMPLFPYYSSSTILKITYLNKIYLWNSSISLCPANDWMKDLCHCGEVSNLFYIFCVHLKRSQMRLAHPHMLLLTYKIPCLQIHFMWGLYIFL